MMFVDAIILVDETRERISYKLEMWKEISESKRFRIWTKNRLYGI